MLDRLALGTANDEDEFKDWVDCLYGFLHLVNPTPKQEDYHLPGGEPDDPALTLFQQTSGTAAKIVEVPSVPYSHFL